MSLINIFIYLYLFLKPYYIFSSGGLQISDFFLIGAFVLFLFASKNKKSILLKSVKENKEIFLFTVLTFLVNGLYYVIFTDFKFILSSLYFMFNLFTIILFSFLFNNKKFLYTISLIFKLNLVIQLFIYILNLGRFYQITRYMGTFNDPNQFGYYILLSTAYIYIIDNLTKKKNNNTIFFLLSFFLIYLSASTGMILGIVSFLILLLINNLRNLGNFINRNKNKIIIIIILLPLSLLLYKITFNSNYLSDISNNFFFQRIEKKINRSQINSSSSMSIWEERGYDKLLIYPQYLIYGSGEGRYDRFNKSAHLNEIHATLPSIWFYYGFIPFFIISIWIYKKIRGLPNNYKVVYLALLIESFTLLNQRQSLFWCVFLLTDIIKEKKYEDSNIYAITK